MWEQGRRRKNFQGGGQRKKDRKIAKGTENSANKPLPEGRGEATEKRPKNSKKTPKNSTIKPLSTIFVPCMKIQVGHSPPPCCRRPCVGDLIGSEFEPHTPTPEVDVLIASSKFK